MGKLTKIGWAHGTQNFWMGCDKIAPECAKCYIGRVLGRQGREPWGEIYRTKTWRDPFAWQKQAEREQRCYRIFTCSLSDFFHVKADQWRAEAWEIMRETPNLVWLVLTKRPSRIAAHLPPGWPDAFPNVWLGVSAGCRQSLPQMAVLRQIPIHPKAVRFLSAEPLLENIAPEIDLDGFSWVITGGESGNNPEYIWNSEDDWREEFNTGGRRTMKLEWARNLREAARSVGARFYFKQITASRPGTGEDALGQPYKEFPAPPHSEWAGKYV